MGRFSHIKTVSLTVGVRKGHGLQNRDGNGVGQVFEGTQV
jgi:hypothetical protein